MKTIDWDPPRAVVLLAFCLGLGDSTQAGLIPTSATRGISAQVGTYAVDATGTESLVGEPYVPFSRSLSLETSAENEFGETSYASAQVSQESTIGTDRISGQSTLHLYAESDAFTGYVPAFADAYSWFSVSFELSEPCDGALLLELALGAPRMGRISTGYGFHGPGFPSDLWVGMLDGYEDAGGRTLEYSGLFGPGIYQLEIWTEGHVTEFDGSEGGGSGSSVNYQLALRGLDDGGDVSCLLGLGLAAVVFARRRG